MTDLKPMTRQEALAEAQKRWGPEARVSSHRSSGHGATNRVYFYEVGAIEGEGDDRGWRQKGSAWGGGYAAAFADAARRIAAKEAK